MLEAFRRLVCPPRDGRPVFDLLHTKTIQYMNNGKFTQTGLIAFMKFTAIQLTIAITVSVVAFANTTRGQEILNRKVSVKASNETARSLLKRIGKQLSVTFTYNSALLSRERRISLDSDSIELGTVLHQIFGAGVEYQALNNQVIIAPATRSDSSTEYLAAIQVSGKVLDEQKQPLPGVSVLERGTTNGTSTDSDGNFTLSVADGNAVLVFSFIGYQSQEIPVGAKTIIDISLTPDVQSLSEVVVVGYGTTKKQDLTTAIAKIDPKEVPMAANSSVGQLLFGRAAGLQVTQGSTEPGGAVNLSIRGRGNPLIVVDGVIYPNTALEPDNGSIDLQGVNRGSLAGLNPSDIESIEVLKDGSAAIYGVNAADGVILITTKKGASGKMNIQYNGSRSVSQTMNYLKPLSAREHMTYFNQFAMDDYLFDHNMAPFGTTPAAGFVPTYTEADIQNAGAGVDYLDKVLRTGSVDNHDLSLSGGTDKAKFYISGNYFNQKGILENSGMKRYTGRVNTSFSLNRFLTLNTNLNLSRSFFSNPGSGSQAGGAGSMAFGMLQAALAYPANVPIYDANGERTTFNGIGNPVGLMQIRDKTTALGLMGNISLDIDIINDVLAAKILYGNNYETSARDFYIPSDVYYGLLYQSRGSVFEMNRQNQTTEAVLTFKKELSDGIKIDAVAGIGQYIEDGNGMGIEANGMLDAVNTSDLSSAPNKTVSSYKFMEKKRSYFARANVDFLDRYVVSVAYRYDGYDKFFPQQKYAGFPSASVAWKISNESFMDNLNGSVDLLKLRVSIGTTGRTMGTIAFGVYEPDGTLVNFEDGSIVYPVYLQTALDHPELKWEKTINTNVGLDFDIFKHVLSGSVDFFRDDISNLINDKADTDQLSSIPKFPTNGGRTIRQGYEIALNATVVKTTDFRWNLLTNISHYTYRWDKRFENAGLQDYIGVKDPYNAIYVYQTNGIIQVGEEIPDWQPANARVAGAPRFVDRNGDGALTTADVKMYRKDPSVVLGVGSKFTYKAFDLNIFLYGQFGAHDWNNGVIWADPISFVAKTNGATTDIKDVWSTSNPDGKWPGITFNPNIVGLPASIDTRLASKNFVRCRNITLGYNFKPSEKVFKNLRVYVDAQNAFVLTKYVGGDPETTASASKGGPAPYPMTRTFSLGVNATF